jgi:hypothetical protein
VSRRIRLPVRKQVPLYLLSFTSTRPSLRPAHLSHTRFTILYFSLLLSLPLPFSFFYVLLFFSSSYVYFLSFLFFLFITMNCSCQISPTPSLISRFEYVIFHSALFLVSSVLICVTKWYKHFSFPYSHTVKKYLKIAYFTRDINSITHFCHCLIFNMVGILYKPQFSHFNAFLCFSYRVCRSDFLTAWIQPLLSFDLDSPHT